jgi:hypothetical protein
MTRAEVDEILKRQNVEVEEQDAHTLYGSDDGGRWSFTSPSTAR